MNRHVRVILLALTIMGCAAPALAQSAMVSGDVGFGQPRDGVPDRQLAMNGAFSFIINGSAEKNFAVLAPVGVEFRRELGSGGTSDIIGSGEVAFRAHNVAFGPGATFGYIFRDDIRDPSCPLSGTIPNGSSCRVGSKAGTRDGGVLFGLGWSGYVRVGFGHQSRGFIQGRIVFYRPSFVQFESGSSFASNFTGVLVPYTPTDLPGFKSGRDLRFAVGWVFGSGSGTAKFVKGQLALRAMRFTHEKANVGGIYDLARLQLTFGGGIAF